MPSTPTARMGAKPSPAWEKAAERANASLGGQPGPRPAIFGEVADPISHLPLKGATKLAVLRQDVEELRTLIGAGVDQQQALIQDRMAAKARLDILTDPAASERHGDGFVYGDDHNSVIQARSEYAKFSDQLERLQVNQKTRSARFNALGGLLRNVEAFLKDATDIAPFDADLVEPTGELPALAVERMRQRRRELLADLREVETAPTPSSIAKEIARQQIELLAKRGRIDFLRIIQTGDTKLRFPKVTQDVMIHGFVPGVDGAPMIVAKGSVSIDDSIAFSAWMFKDTMLKRAMAEIDAAASDDEALSPEEQAARVADIEAEILATERIEEAFTELAGGDVVRRPDLNPRAFLAIL